MPACQKASVISRSTATFVGLGVARVDEPLRGQLVVALVHRVLRGGHEALDAVGRRVGLGEVDEPQRVGRHGPDAGLELHARPLLDVVAVAGEVDAGDRADAPLRVAEAARVAMDDGVVRAPARRTGRCVRDRRRRARCALLVLVGARAGLGARLARRGGADLDRRRRDPAAARALGQRLELVGRLVDRLEVALVRELLAGRGEVGVPDLGLPAACQLDVALVERRLELQEEQRLLDVQDLRHRPLTVNGDPHEGTTARGG